MRRDILKCCISNYMPARSAEGKAAPGRVVQALGFGASVLSAGKLSVWVFRHHSSSSFVGFIPGCRQLRVPTTDGPV